MVQDKRNHIHCSGMAFRPGNIFSDDPEGQDILQFLITKDELGNFRYQYHFSCYSTFGYSPRKIYG